MVQIINISEKILKNFMTEVAPVSRRTEVGNTFLNH